MIKETTTLLKDAIQRSIIVIGSLAHLAYLYFSLRWFAARFRA